LILALSGDDLRPPFALALGLPSHRPLHLSRDLHILDLDYADLHPPGIGLLVYDALELLVYLLPVCQELIEVLLAKDAPQSSLGDLAGGQHVILDLDDAPVRVDYSEVDDGVHPGGDVVAGYDVLGRDVHGYGPQVYLDHPVHERPQEEQPWSLGPSLNPTEPKDHTPLVLLDDLDGTEHDRGHHYDDHHEGDERETHADGLQEREPHKIVLLSGCHATYTDSITAKRGPDTREGGPYWTSLSKYTRRPEALLEEPPRSHVASHGIYTGDGHITGIVRGVDGRPVAHRYTNVGDGPAAVLTPEEEVSRLGSTPDRGTVAHLGPRRIRQGDAELLED